MGESTQKSIGEALPKAFDSQKQEVNIYAEWEKRKFFSPETVADLLKKQGREVKHSFTITLPPPNANDDLHLGHMAGYAYHDAFGRFYRMSGHPTLLLPGKDHAGIQTEAVFVRVLARQGIDKWEIGRDEFNKRCYEYSTNAAKIAQAQEKRIGLSADWDREFFTLDPRLTEVIYKTFEDMYADGLIYRGKYIINQCPHCRTALADIDTEHKEMRGIFAYILYPFADEADNDRAEEVLGHRGVMVATTRPETMLGDTAIAVHPEDERYRDFIGKKVIIPIAKREIPIITSEEIDMSTGTGALKVTPAHSPIDFEIRNKHNEENPDSPIDILNVIDETGKMTGDIPERFKGMGTIECSKALVQELDKAGLLEKIENIKHDVSVCERCDTPIEPIVSNQWFVDVKPLAKRALEELDKGSVKVIPKGQQNALKHFYENIIPWCISRQLWWGHRIPVWYSGGRDLHDWLNDHPGSTVEDYEKETGNKVQGTGKVLVSDEKPETDPDWQGKPEDLLLEPESDVFDTWFSSGQWPFSTLGGPDGEDFKKYFPTQYMIHARDILFWWSARMIMFSLYRTGQVPFNTVLLTGLIFGTDGKKMSKSRENGIPPKEILSKYGADALRLWYYTDALPGANAPLQEDKIKGNRHFVNKIWNASRFVLMNIYPDEVPAIADELDNLQSVWQGTSADSDADDRMAQQKRFHQNMMTHYKENRLHLVANGVREHFWGVFADKWIEDVKNEIQGKSIGDPQRVKVLSELLFLLMQNLKVMHPLVPFVTESVWREFAGAGIIADDRWLIVEDLEA